MSQISKIKYFEKPLKQSLSNQAIQYHIENARLSTEILIPGVYFVIGFNENGQKYFSEKVVKF